MTENIDVSQWLPRGESSVTHYRLAKGDIAANEGRYYQIYPLAIDWMLSAGLLSDDQHYAALEITSLHEVALSSFGYAKLKLLADWLGRSIQHSECPMTILSRISRKMMPYQYAMIERICFKPVRDNDRAWIHHCRGTIAESFEKLIKVIDEIRQAELDSETEEGINTPRVPQPAMSS